MSLMSSSLLLQQCLACLDHLAWVVLVMGDKWPYSCCFMECYFQDMFKIIRSLLMQFLSSFFSRYFVSVHVLHLKSSIDTTAAWKKSHFILLDRSDFHMIDSQILISLLVDGMLLRYGNLSSNIRELPSRVEMGVCVLVATSLLLLAPGYTAGIGQMCLQEALCHLHSLHPL